LNAFLDTRKESESDKSYLAVSIGEIFIGKEFRGGPLGRRNTESNSVDSRLPPVPSAVSELNARARSVLVTRDINLSIHV